MRTALFVDFEDSFSFNVIQQLKETGFKVRHILWSDLQTTPTEDLLVLGPGPGHPDDYQNIFPIVSGWLEKEKPFFGVCLGHQIYWRILGAEIRRSAHPKHGQSIPLKLSPEWQRELALPAEINVQLYNSLCVPWVGEFSHENTRSVVQDGEILITKGYRLLTYQFHPESEGTTFRQALFRPLLQDLV
jgi:anthranilate/para-aminobenzoate synthase component II